MRLVLEFIRPPPAFTPGLCPRRLRLTGWLLAFCGWLVASVGVNPSARAEDRYLSTSSATLPRALEVSRLARPRLDLPPTPDASAGNTPAAGLTVAGPYPWKYNITTTVFWVGEPASLERPVSNEQSAWDPDWVLRYGGVDTPDPAARRNFVPAGFVPGLNPFYVALPYNDVDDHRTKPEATLVVPWFRGAFVREGASVCKGRWVAIRHGRRVCYAQWEDVGPFAADHWQYVFGMERPRPNANQGAGLDVSPAVRDYLGLGGIDHCDWKFVDLARVPFGPWSLYGADNPFARLRAPKVGRLP
ncbi:MAG: hypothetical protein JO015_16420 [Verrucomicrobia bacterium]|nr:hypothetical protein [Verrucomicrobiota bacterium]